jgi:predicted transcriptional regulator
MRRREARLESSDVYLYIMRRTQIYLDDGQTARLDERAAAEGVTRSMMIRRAVEQYLTRGERDTEAWQAQWQKAVRRTAGAAPYLPQGAAYVEALRTADADRLLRLES